MQGARARWSRARLLVLPVVVALSALVLLPLNSGYQDGVAAAHEQEQQTVLLDVALVNEDTGATVDGEQVNLGRSYLTQVESDTSATWHVVSRGVAENGLATGGYQLMVVIPAGFSGTLLDLDQEEPDPVAVTYQVNGAGSARVETIASGKGAEIVASLNEQLVDVYVASILANLRQAQDNVRLLVDAQTASTATFTADLLPAGTALDESLAELGQRGDGLLTTGQDAVTGLSELATAAEESATAQGEHDRSLTDLLAARDAGELGYAAFLEQLLALDARLLGDEVQQLYDELVASGADLAAQLSTDGTETANHADDLAALQETVDRTAAAVRTRSDELAALDEAAVLAAYRGAAYARIDADGDGAVSLAEVAAAVRGDDGTPLASPGATALLQQVAEELVARLPYRSADELAVAVDEGVFARAGGQFDALADQVAADLATVTAWSGHPEVAADAEVVGADLDATVAALDAAEQTGSGSRATSGSVATLSAAAARYGAEVTEVAEAYRAAARAVTVLQDCATVCGTLPELDVSAAVDAVVATAVAQELATERTVQEQLSGLVTGLQAEMVELTGSFEELTAISEQLSVGIAGQLDDLETMRTSMATILDSEQSAADATADVGSRTRSIAGEATGLLAQSSALAARTQAAVGTGEGVQSLVDAVRDDLARANEGSTTLTTGSDLLAQTLADEVEDAQLFSSTFDGVLSNSYRAGVLNERLLGFLVSPVEATPREPVASTDVSRPFAWVLIAFAVCLGAVCALASITRRRRPASAFDRDRTRWFWANLRALGPVTVVAAVLGTGLAWASAADLGVPRESQLRWALCVVLACVEISLVVHALVRQWRLVGVGLSVLLPVGYVLVTDAVGAGAGSGLPAVVSRLDPLCHAERALVAVLGSDPAGLGAAGRMLVGIAVALVAGLLVRIDLRALRPARRTVEARA